MTHADVQHPAGGDPFGLTMLADPYPDYERVRAATPVYWSTFFHSWVAMRYADVKTCLFDPRLSSAMTRDAQTAQLSAELRERLAPINDILGLWMVFQDHPEHRRLRQLFTAAFTPRTVERLRGRIQALADDLIDAVQERGQLDLVADFTVPMPIMVITELLGVPKSDSALLQGWARGIGLFFVIGSCGNDATLAVLQQAVEQMMAYLGEVVAARRRAPREDLISDLIAVETQGERLNETEMLSHCILMLIAGHESTTATISSGMLHLLRNPDQYRLLAENPALVESAFEEALRYEAPFQTGERVATVDLEVGSQRIQAGEQIIACIGAANHDPAQFPDPERFDIRRQPNPHLSFGHGPHFCLGASLARLEGAIAFNTLLRRLPNLQLGGEGAAWREPFGPRVLDRLPLTFTPGAAGQGRADR